MIRLWTIFYCLSNKTNFLLKKISQNNRNIFNKTCFVILTNSFFYVLKINNFICLLYAFLPWYLILTSSNVWLTSAIKFDSWCSWYISFSQFSNCVSFSPIKWTKSNILNDVKMLFINLLMVTIYWLSTLLEAFSVSVSVSSSLIFNFCLKFRRNTFAYINWLFFYRYSL